MKRKIANRAVVLVCVVVLLWGVGLLARPVAPAAGGSALHLQAPPFLGAVQAQEASVASLIGDEAGICAYFNAGATVDLALVEVAYRTIEAKTPEYIIGSVAVDDYPELDDVHVYVHKDGWFMAYYMEADPVAKIFDFKNYNGTSLVTRFDKILASIANQARVPFRSPAYYDFRYPNANRLMLVAETYEGGNDFTITMPSEFTYWERSWGLIGCGSPYDIPHGCSGSFGIDGNAIVSQWCNGVVGQGYLTAAQLAPGDAHKITVCAHGGLALIYQVP